MDRPKPTTMLLASTWLAHMNADTAWEEMREIVESDPDRAWRMIRAMVGSAPAYDVLAAIAAGPLEDLLDGHADSFMPVIFEEARRSTRLRICLRATYSDLPHDLKIIVEGESADVREVPVDETIIVPGNDLALVVAWLHHADTAWAVEFLKEMTESDAPAAWEVLRLLAIFAEEDPRVRDSVYDDAFEPFMRRHFSEVRSELVAFGQRSASFQEWVRDVRRPPINNESWTEFMREIVPSDSFQNSTSS